MQDFYNYFIHLSVSSLREDYDGLIYLATLTALVSLITVTFT
jgi:hypothetical protein